ncbi:ssDNA-binding protein [Phyllosticta citribraziliensis]|uniref:Single-stranded DNA-binding protein n=1 Tax=Phyllosticta citribraziliensis TaxID=989973 RepID=A0ABR1LHZ8_9PEZI
MFALRRFNTTLSASARSFSSSPRSQLAKFTLVGRLARDPELRTSSKGEEFITYSIACRDGNKGNSETSFYNVSRFGLTDGLKSLLLSLPKGTLVHVSADASQNKREGETIPRLLLRQRDLEVLSKPRPREDQQEQQHESQF